MPTSSALMARVAREHFWRFLKNFRLVGGLLLVGFAGALTPPVETARPAAWSFRAP